MWIIFRAFVHIWTWISTRLFVKKNAQTTESDIEKVAGSGKDLRMQAMRARHQYEEREAGMFQNGLISLHQREVVMLQRPGNTSHCSRKYYGLRRGTGPIENDPYRMAPPPCPKRAKQLRKHSAKYRLRQGEYVDNWDCELSDLYGKRSPPQPSTPSPLLSGTSPLIAGEDIKEEPYRFPGRWPALPCTTTTVSTSRILRSPFLASSELQSSKPSPFLAQFTDLTQTIMTDFKPVGYSTNALSAVTDTFWDAPAVMPAKPARVFGASYNQSDTNDMLAASSSVGLIWTLPSFPNHELICGEEI